MLRTASVVALALASAAVVRADREHPQVMPCCTVPYPLAYKQLTTAKPTEFELATISNLDHAHGDDFYACLSDHGEAAFILELAFDAGKPVPRRVRARGTAAVVACVERLGWTYFGPPARDTVVRFRISDPYKRSPPRAHSQRRR